MTTKQLIEALSSTDENAQAYVVVHNRKYRLDDLTVSPNTGSLMIWAPFSDLGEPTAEEHLVYSGIWGPRDPSLPAPKGLTRDRLVASAH